MYIKTKNTVNSHHFISTTPQSNHFAPVDRIQVWIDKGVPSEVRPHKSASPHSPLGKVGFEKKPAKDSTKWTTGIWEWWSRARGSPKSHGDIEKHSNKSVVPNHEIEHTFSEKVGKLAAKIKGPILMFQKSGLHMQSSNDHDGTPRFRHSLTSGPPQFPTRRQWAGQTWCMPCVEERYLGWSWFKAEDDNL